MNGSLTGYYLFGETCLELGGTCAHGELATLPSRTQANQCGTCDAGFSLMSTRAPVITADGGSRKNFPPSKVLDDDGDGQDHIWLSPDGTTSWFTMDLHVARSVYAFQIRNTFNDDNRNRATTKFRIDGSVDNTKWQTVVLAHSLSLSYDLVTVPTADPKFSKMRFVKFTILDYYDQGGGLGFFQPVYSTGDPTAAAKTSTFFDAPHVLVGSGPNTGTCGGRAKY